jgi:N-acetylglucosaminyl-diphospho-decaprenol L-rhamnosyltransferase
VSVPDTAAVSVLIVSWNARDRLARCLHAATASAREVVVADNASSDGSAALVAGQFPGVRLLRLPRNLGFAGGVNEAARHATGDLLLLVNPDAILTPGAVARLAHVITGDPGWGAAAARLIGTDGRPQDGFNVRRFPTFGSWMSDLLLLDEVWPGNPARRRYRYGDLRIAGPDPVDVEQPAAACLMIRRDVFEAVGGMDERFTPAWFEDVDLCRRIRARGWRIALVPDAHVQHEGGDAMRALGLDRFTRIWYRNMQRYARVHHGVLGLLGLKALIVPGMLLRAAVAALRVDGAAARVYLATAGRALVTWPRSGV